VIKFIFQEKTIEVPDCWDDVTVEHFINPYFLSGNSIELLSSLSGIPAVKIANTTEDMAPHFEKTVAFIKKDFKGWQGEPKKIKLDLLGVSCVIPKNIELESFGKKIMMGDAIAKHKFVYQGIPEAIAIYLGEQIYPDDWYTRIDEIKEAVLKLPINKVYNIAAFFLILSKKFLKGGANL